ncbi:MAG: AraC family transcriptional regulator [Betaproteobacteria bacterium HGW-Betaproteobacteria-18]|jgi:AraC family transcriptional activator of pobA|nr:MAG: AraC family transcriptional regulator [Betaproteobacteria bacterium HGW-Betaproteobacteria-6]PKO62710.1 MAG: AraC family transcriptional regulator [Betaproteobacteria bacterium HGW-Betaproteobacteria-18]PKO91438.1 MAG: AraC family transcriptional regulator [Betaproteobacteria bacterium HGW-Betaproteobacteria-10]
MSVLVPTFSLYGEAQTAVSREFIHIEEISARSAARNWQIDTHTHEGLLQVLFVFSGTARVRLDNLEQDYEPPLAVVIPPGVIHAFKFMPQTEGCVLTLDSAGLASQSEDATQMFAVLRGAAEVIHLSGEDGQSARRIRGLLDQIEAEFRAPGAASVRLQVWLVRALLLLLVRERLRADESAEGKSNALMEKFRQLVEAHYAEHWPVETYAAALNLTESRLNRLSRKLSGQTAFALTQERLLLEARRKLIYTATPVSQLAYELGFSDPAYFCRFFKKLSGQAPSVFRASSTR